MTKLRDKILKIINRWNPMEDEPEDLADDIEKAVRLDEKKIIKLVDDVMYIASWEIDQSKQLAQALVTAQEGGKL